MADLRAHPEQDEEHEGASPGEILIEAARRNNVELLREVLDGCKNEDEAAKLLNETKTVLGNYAYHEAALQGNSDVIDVLLDQPGFECDPISRIDGDTPLHSAVRYFNKLWLEHPNNPAVVESASELLSMMIEAGSDPKIRNKGNSTALQLVDPKNTELRDKLQDIIYADANRGDFVEENGGLTAADADIIDDEEGDVGSGSDSDFDPEEYRRERERRKIGGKK